MRILRELINVVESTPSSYAPKQGKEKNIRKRENRILEIQNKKQEERTNHFSCVEFGEKSGVSFEGEEEEEEEEEEELDNEKGRV